MCLVEGELFELDERGGVVLRVHVQPGAGRSELVGRHGDAVKVRVAVPPERGRANDACRRLLAEVFDLEESAVALVAGETSRSKRFALSDVEPDALRAQLERLLERGPPRAPADHQRSGPRSSRP